ncbi:hypothetical protein C8R43DRAFT_1053423 [Mycena crocata]|nr:hypothetical protein C8R43DRAFT_1053423 [Mycena crocata]
MPRTPKRRQIRRALCVHGSRGRRDPRYAVRLPSFPRCPPLSNTGRSSASAGTPQHIGRIVLQRTPLVKLPKSPCRHTSPEVRVLHACRTHNCAGVFVVRRVCAATRSPRWLRYTHPAHRPHSARSPYCASHESLDRAQSRHSGRMTRRVQTLSTGDSPTERTTATTGATPKSGDFVVQNYSLRFRAAGERRDKYEHAHPVGAPTVLRSRLRATERCGDGASPSFSPSRSLSA